MSRLASHTDLRGSERRPAALKLAFVLMGCVALTAQALLLRELMVSWQGNEISFGVVLAVWLAAAGGGSVIGGAAARRTRDHTRALAWGLIAAGVLTPAALSAARLARLIVGVPPGELAGLGPLIAATAFSVVPLAALSGSLFAAAVATVSRGRDDAGRAVSLVYVLEAAGAVFAGLATSLVLFGRVAPFRIGAMAATLACAGGLVVLFAGRPIRRTRFEAAAALALAVLALWAAGPTGDALETRLAALAWRGSGFVSETHSRHGLIVATERGSQKSMFENGALVASVPDRLAAEEAVHLAMLEHPRPVSVLLLGGVLGGAVEEILKHPTVRRIDCVELDPALVGAAERAFGDAMTRALSDPRVSVHYADARFFVKRTTGSYDVVIVNMPDPVTARTNRFYTAEFMAEVEAVLARGGVAGFAVSSAEEYVGPELATLLACVRRSLGSVFTRVLLVPGDPCHFIASDAPEYLTLDAGVLSSRIEARALDVVHVRDYYLADRLSPDRVAYLEEQVAAADAPVNTDLSPACYFLSLVLWSRRVSPGSGALLAAPRVLTVPHAALLAAALAAALAAVAARRGSGRGLRAVVLAAVTIAGLTEIGIEIAAFLVFQSVYGFVYHLVAAITGAFMGGLALGGWLGGRAALRGAGARTVLCITAALAAAPQAVARVAGLIATLPPERAALGVTLVPLLVVGSAILAGALFPIAARILSRAGGTAQSGGRVYGADLLGAAAGALVSAVALLPIMGLASTMLVLSLLNASVAVALAVALLAGARRGAAAHV
jgi:spermidine synthase